MKMGMQSFLPLLLAVAATSAHGQFYKLKGASVSIGATEHFDTTLTTNTTTGSYVVATPTGGVLTETVSGQQQYTSTSTGGLFSLQFHPVAFAGVEVNYGVTKYSERYAFNYSSASATQVVNVPTWSHEATAAYEFHPPHIPLQPFVNIGGGAVDFLPAFASNQWRGTGLVEAGLDVPLGNKHIAMRVEGRVLIYRAPNFSNPEISTRSWRATEEPSISFVYRF